jgi:hypothetical protein
MTLLSICGLSMLSFVCVNCLAEWAIHSRQERQRLILQGLYVEGKSWQELQDEPSCKPDNNFKGAEQSPGINSK